MTDLSLLKKLSIGGISLKRLLVDGVPVFKSGYKNWVTCAMDTDGSIYNGIGYKDGYRVRSGGAEAVEDGGRITGYIPVTAGDTVRLSGWNFGFQSAANAVNFSDSNFTNLGQFTTQPVSYGICLGATPTVTVSNGVYTFIVPNDEDIHYLRVTGQQAYQTLPPEMIVTVNEEISA